MYITANKQQLSIRLTWLVHFEPAHFLRFQYDVAYVSHSSLPVESLDLSTQKKKFNSENSLWENHRLNWTTPLDYLSMPRRETLSECWGMDTTWMVLRTAYTYEVVRVVGRSIWRCCLFIYIYIYIQWYVGCIYQTPSFVPSISLSLSLSPFFLLPSHKYPISGRLTGD